MTHMLKLLSSRHLQKLVWVGLIAILLEGCSDSLSGLPVVVEHDLSKPGFKSELTARLVLTSWPSKQRWVGILISVPARENQPWSVSCARIRAELKKCELPGQFAVKIVRVSDHMEVVNETANPEATGGFGLNLDGSPILGGPHSKITALLVQKELAAGTYVISVENTKSINQLQNPIGQVSFDVLTK